MKNTYKIAILILLTGVIYTCKEKPIPPTLSTIVVSEITYTTATSGGNVTNEGGDPVTIAGICWNTSADPTISNSKTIESSGLSAFTSNLTQLSPNTMYYVRAYATNSVSTSYGNQVSFTTLEVEVPVITTTEVTSITQTTAIAGGNITDQKGGSVTERGICWGTSQSPTIADNKTVDGTGSDTFTCSITGLTLGVNYYVRAFATNNKGTGYGNTISFRSQIGEKIFNADLTYGIVTDVDENIYQTITIEDKTWMAENLKTTKYNDGISIPLVTDNASWAALSSPGYSFLNNDSATYKQIYGALYNWHSVNTSKLCPMGWRVPNSDEWISLVKYLEGENIAGGKLKEVGDTHWESPNIGATNESGFTALPGGLRDWDGQFRFINTDGNWWSATEFEDINAWYFGIINSLSTGFMGQSMKTRGFFVRCVQSLTPLISTTHVKFITGNSSIVTVSGEASSDVDAIITDRGVYWGLLQNTETTGTKLQIGSGTGSFSANLTDLTPNTTYYVRAYASNNAGTSYGKELVFKTYTGTVADIESNVYNTVTIGSQVWMVENLKTTKYNNDIDIPLITDRGTWFELKTPGYCWYNNDENTNKDTQGALYNWYTVNTGKLCPSGWHVPSDDDWTTLIAYLGGESEAGIKLKEIGTTHWNLPQSKATNETSFTALPSGCREQDGAFWSMGYYGLWWSNTEYASSFAWNRKMSYCNDGVWRDSSCGKESGLSVRCLKN